MSEHEVLPWTLANDYNELHKVTNQFSALVHFYYPLRLSENQTIFWNHYKIKKLTYVFVGYWKRIFATFSVCVTNLKIKTNPMPSYIFLVRPVLFEKVFHLKKFWSQSKTLISFTQQRYVWGSFCDVFLLLLYLVQ